MSFFSDEQTKLPEDDKTSDPIVTEHTPLHPSIPVGQYQATDPYQGYGVPTYPRPPNPQLS